MSVRVAIIAAVAENGVIGASGDMPWRIPSDFAHLKRVTMGKPLIMGRKTFESIGKPLPGRTNIVVTRQTGYQPDGVIVVSDLESALTHAKTIAETDGVDEVVIFGGAEIYRQGMPLADRLYITHVALAPEGDTYFPEIDPEVWTIVETPPIEKSEKDSAAYIIHNYERLIPATH